MADQQQRGPRFAGPENRKKRKIVRRELVIGMANTINKQKADNEFKKGNIKEQIEVFNEDVPKHKRWLTYGMLQKKAARMRQKEKERKQNLQQKLALEEALKKKKTGRPKGTTIAEEAARSETREVAH